MRITIAIFASLCSSAAAGVAFAPVSRKSAFVSSTPSQRKSSTSSRSSSSALHMAKAGPMFVRPIGVGSAAPSTVITNKDLEKFMDTSDEWIRTRTGIGERRILQHGVETLRDLEIKAAKAALEMAKTDPSELSMVICGSSTPDDLFGDAASIAAELGCSTDTVAFDLSAACSGFIFSTITAAKYLSAPNPDSKKKILIIGADSLSRWIDWNDRNVCILFGDGAGAMVLESSPGHAGLMGYSIHSNGKGYCDLNSNYNGEPTKVADGLVVSRGQYSTLNMKGKEVYKFATREVPIALQEALDAAGITAADVDWLLLHQANIRIMEVVAERFGIPMEKVITNLARYGNTSAASIPLALDEAVREGKVKKGDVILTAGFGAGLSWGATILKWG